MRELGETARKERQLLSTELFGGSRAYLHQAMRERGSQAMFTGIQAPRIYLHFVLQNKHKITVVIRTEVKTREL